MSEERNEELVTDDVVADQETAEDTAVNADNEEAQFDADEQISVSAGEYETLKNAVTELREQLMRQQAEFENTRRRLRKTADEAGVRSLARFIRPLLNEMDNFEMAIKAANPEKFNDFAMGVTMIHENLKNIFGGSGIEFIPAEGIFDPAVHEVVAEIEMDGKDRGEIIEVQRTGYKMGDQVVRAAQVIVAKPPAAEEAEPAAETSDDEEQSAEAEA